MNSVFSMAGAMCGAVVVATGVAALGYVRTLDPATINQAIAVGLSRSDADRARFHRPYRFDVNRPPVDWIDLITPFRRVVLAAESNTRDGGRLYGQREAMALLSTAPGQVDVVVELTFHPLNTFVGVPAYDVELVRASERIAPVDAVRVPRFGPRVSGTPLPYPFGGALAAPRGTQPLLGGTIAAHFDGGLLDAEGVYDLVVAEDGKELVRTRMALRGIR